MLSAKTIPWKEATFCMYSSVRDEQCASFSTETGLCRDSKITEQIQVMNTNFKGSGVVFTLSSTDRTVNPSWTSIDQEGAAQTEMKKQLRKGSAGDLNIYSVELVVYFLIHSVTYPHET
jgi:hypothetical protein